MLKRHGRIMGISLVRVTLTHGTHLFYCAAVNVNLMYGLDSDVKTKRSLYFRPWWYVKVWRA